MIAVVGAGPFGLSVAAHVPDARVYGEPMRTWRRDMPADMLMRSAWEETSLSAPGGGGIDEFAADTGTPKQEPLPLRTFLHYADWFRERHVRDSDPSDVERVEPAGKGLRITTAEGRVADARAIVIAVGVTPFAYAPQPFAEALGAGVELASARRDELERFAGKRVVVIGAGQNALETAGVVARAGADVELLARSPVRWFAPREPGTPRGPVRRRLYRLAYPAVGYGPPPINRIVLHPDLFAALPFSVRRVLNQRLLRPGGSPWLRSLVDGKVRVTEGVTVRALDRRDCLRLELSDGSEREADFVLLGTGYRFDRDRLEFLDRRLRSGIQTKHGWPCLDRQFRSTEPRLFFVGYPAELRFGPISRFVLGAEFSAKRVAAALSA